MSLSHLYDRMQGSYAELSSTVFIMSPSQPSISSSMPTFDRLVEELLDGVEVVSFLRHNEVDFVWYHVESFTKRDSSSGQSRLEKAFSVEVQAIEQKDADLVLDVLYLHILLCTTHQDLKWQNLALESMKFTVVWSMPTISESMIKSLVVSFIAESMFLQTSGYCAVMFSRFLE